MTVRIEIIIAVIMITVGAIGWLINKSVSVVKELIDVVTEFRIVLSALQEDSKNINLNCPLKHGVVDQRLNSHSAKLEAHGLLLAEHEVKIKELQK